MNEVVELPLGSVRPNPHQPRKFFSTADLEDLAESIAEQGLLQPITVRVVEGGFEIVCGERRYRAHQLRGLPTIRSLVTRMSDEQMADAAIIENLQRRDITPLEEAHAFQRRLDAGLTVEQLATRLGLKQAWRITERTQLLKLLPEFQEALRTGILTPSQAFELSRHPAHHQRELFDAIGEGRCPTYGDLRAVSQGLVHRRAQTDMFAGLECPTEPAETQEAAQRIERTVEALSRLLRASFSDNEVMLKIRPARAQHFCQQLDVIEKSVRRLRLTLLTTATATRKAG